MENVPPALFLKTGRRLADRQQFRGNHDNIKTLHGVWASTFCSVRAY